MARPSGSRNPGYEQKKRRLAQAAMGPVLDLAEPLSLRGVARTAGVSVPTMRHYFGDLDGVIRATFDLMREQGRPYSRRLAGVAEPPGSLEASVRWVVRYVHNGWKIGVSRMHAAGLARGLCAPTAGQAYLDGLLEPMLQGVERRLSTHVERGEMRDVDVRQATLSLVAPLVLAWLHQDALGGGDCRPMDTDAFTQGHIAGWLAGYGRAAAA